MIDNVEKLGIAQHFRDEIKSVLHETYRYWLQGDEEIHLDISTCAMAFWLLRMNGYNISSDALFEFSEEEAVSNLVGGHVKSMGTVLELYKASQIMTSSNEPVLEKLHSWSSQFLKQKLSNGAMLVDGLHKDIGDEANAEYLKDMRVVLPVQINGKTRGTIQVEEACTEDDALRLASSNDKLSKYFQRRTIKKRIFVPGRILNVILEQQKVGR